MRDKVVIAPDMDKHSFAWQHLPHSSLIVDLGSRKNVQSSKRYLRIRWRNNLRSLRPQLHRRSDTTDGRIHSVSYIHAHNFVYYEGDGLLQSIRSESLRLSVSVEIFVTCRSTDNDSEIMLEMKYSDSGDALTLANNNRVASKKIFEQLQQSTRTSSHNALSEGHMLHRQPSGAQKRIRQRQEQKWLKAISANVNSCDVEIERNRTQSRSEKQTAYSPTQPELEKVPTDP
ncbi:hypothetical protein DINM_002124 [Dirofilaria immitis]|nr:hypothetical protein [Dirofilaria immitis]